MRIHVRERVGWEGLSLCELRKLKEKRNADTCERKGRLGRFVSLSYLFANCVGSQWERERDDARGGNQIIINNKKIKNKKTKFLDHVASTTHTSHHLSFSGMVGYLICGSMSRTSVILMVFFLITRHLFERTNFLEHTHNSCTRDPNKSEMKNEIKDLGGHNSISLVKQIF